MDRRFARKCEAVYSFWGVTTDVVLCEGKELVNVLENIVDESGDSEKLDE